jgi:rubrerythrin
MPAKITKDQFLKELKKAHKGKLVKLDEYTSKDKKHNIKCLDCGHTWWATGYTLTKEKPNGCPKCARKTVSSKLATPLKSFLLALKAQHGSSIKYVSGYSSMGDKATFKCFECKHIWSTRCSSLTKENPHGCPKCSSKRNGQIKTKSTKDYCDEVFECHGTAITVLEDYLASKTKIKHACSVCNHVWKATPDQVVGIRPHGCPKCKAVKVGLANTKTERVFKKQLYSIHKDSIQLISPYTKQTSLLSFRCSKDHIWATKQAHSLVSKENPSGCPYCSASISKGEDSLYKFVLSFCDDAQKSIRKIRDPKTGGLLEWDIFIPSKNIAIEYNGVYFHSFPRKDYDYHLRKTQASAKVGVRLIHVSDLDWRLNKRVVQKTLKHALGVTSKRYYARKLTISKNTKLTKLRRAFYEANHLQGSPRKGITYALKDGKKLIALMTFCKIQSERGLKFSKGHYELIRFACNGSIIGGASKLFTAFLREYNPKRIISYSQNDWFSGAVYAQLNFKLIKEIGPDYRTVWAGRLKHKSYTRRNKLAKRLGNKFNAQLTEMENLIHNNISILFDSGKKKWEWIKL